MFANRDLSEAAVAGIQMTCNHVEQRQDKLRINRSILVIPFSYVLLNISCMQRSSAVLNRHWKDNTNIGGKIKGNSKGSVPGGIF
jgi:hypothetical protein